MVELLTVIAIISVLASIVIPIAGSVKNNARRSKAISNLRNVAQSLALYRLDERGFPPALGVFYPTAATDPASFLYPEYVKNVGDLRVETTHDVPDPRELVAVTVDSRNVAPDASNPLMQGAKVERGSTLDGQWVPDPQNPDDPTRGVYDLRYSRYRPIQGPSDPDRGRDLSRPYPREDAVVTWVTFQGTRGSPNAQDLVLFLNGTVQKFPSEQVAQQRWRIRPRE